MLQKEAASIREKLFQIPEGTFGTIRLVRKILTGFSFQIPEGTFGTG